MTENRYVLVVEDDPFYSKIYKTKLAKDNIQSEIVGNGIEALATVKKNRPGLILLDLIMPGKDGFETLAELKADKATEHIPVIVLSNLSQEEDISRILALGAVEYLVKANVPIQTVIDKVKLHLGVS
ncbi:MAG: response regulator [Candidatus Moranbacteria bacterium]|jgi:putative two-component system response regulator|nr:response regulator [Candidatus Moranbacteria bacterium]